jgi:signal transduction histidine kinase
MSRSQPVRHNLSLGPQLRPEVVRVLAPPAFSGEGHSTGRAVPSHASRRRGASSSRDEELKEAAQRGAEEERRRLGRELHDSIQQELAAIRMMAAVLTERLETVRLRGDRMTGEREFRDLVGRTRGIAEMLGRTMQHVRQIAQGEVLDEISARGLAAELKNLAEVLREAGMEASFRCAGDPAAPDPAAAAHLYRIAQEAVTNALKHSGATRVMISLSATGNRLELRVRDNGAGLRQDMNVTEGLAAAFRSMRHRAELIGASLEIGDAPERGFEVVCTLPRD